LQFKSGDLYRIQDQESSLNRFSAIGNFRYVQLQYIPADSQSADYNKLHVQLYLSPYNRRALNFEAQALAKSNNFVGPALLTTYTNRNLFKGGELFKLTAKLGFETQLAGGRSTGLFAYEVGLQAELMVPRLVLPFETTPKTGYGIPKTRFTLGGSSLNRVNLYRLHAAQLGYGFNWQKNRFIYQEFTPINVSFTGLGQTGPAFDSILAANAFLQRSFDQRFIAGLTYLFQFSELNEPGKRNRFFTQLGVDLSGNALHAIQSAQGKAGSLFGQAYAHYARVDLDVRHYWQIKRNHRLVSRVFAAYGQPLGSTTSLPYIKQFFSGGPNSVRAFRIRSLGPGTYRPASVDLQSFFDQAGDIKLEFNLEYRFPLGGFLQGALFADAGNVWLANENPDLPGSGFSSQALRQLAFGSGLGLRIDVSLLVLRFDLAMPLRKPWLAGGGWFDFQTSPGNSWASEHLILNFGIGYPF
jgi:outer membrane protein assembly factor BamA